MSQITMEQALTKQLEASEEQRKFLVDKLKKVQVVATQMVADGEMTPEALVKILDATIEV